MPGGRGHQEGPAGVRTINSFFHDTQTTDQAQLYGFAEVEPALWLINDYERGLFNGSLGRVVSVTNSLIIDFDSVSQEIDAADLAGSWTERCSTRLLPGQRSRLSWSATAEPLKGL